MERFKYILVAIILLNCSCDSFLTREPISSIPTTSYPETEQDADALLAGLYDAIQGALSVNFFTWGDVRSDIVEKNGGGDDKLLNNSITATHSAANWENLYKVILSSNILIKYIPDVELNDEKKNNILGQAYAARALMYFYGLRNWGKMPLVTEPFENKPGQNMFVARSPIEDVEKRILEDLKEAERLLEPIAPSSCFYINIGTVKAILTDFYMWKNDYDNAITASDYFLPENKCPFTYAQGTTGWKEIFVKPEVSKEPLFTLAWDYTEDGRHGMFVEYGCSDRSSKYKVSESIWNEFVDRKDKDVRFALMLDTLRIHNSYGTNLDRATYSSSTAMADYACCKYIEQNPVDGSYTLPSSVDYSIQITLYRYTGVMLLRAEALAKRGNAEDLSEAIEIINTVRSRVGYDVTMLPTSSQQDIIDAIDLERRLELWGEGVRWYDLIRQDRVIEVMDPVLKARGNENGFGDKQYILWPIHQAAFEGNPLLSGDQNPGYSES